MDTYLGLILAFVAGAINAGGFLAIGLYTSHMTGLLSSLAYDIATHKVIAGFAVLSYFLAFLAGAITSTLLVNWARAKRLHSEFALVLLWEAMLLTIFALFAPHLAKTGGGIAANLTIALLCYTMGLQNAVITKVSKAVIRTTHVTGITTDLGIEIGRYLFSRIIQSKSTGFDLRKIRLFLGLLLCFLCGGVLGSALFAIEGFYGVMPFALLLAIIASIPVWDDIHGRKYS